MGLPDVVVVGSGIAGLSAAFHAKRAGASVIVVGEAAVGSASAAGAGIVSPGNRWADGDRMLPYVRAAGAHFASFLDEVAQYTSVPVGYVRNGAVHVALSENEVTELDALLVQLQERRAVGFEHIGAVHRLSEAEVTGHSWVAGANYGGILIEEAGRVDAVQLCAALTGALRALGVEHRQAAAHVSTEGGVSVDGSELPAGAVVLATGAWPSEPWPAPWASRPQRGLLLDMQVEDEVPPEILPSLMGFGSHYAVPFDGGRFLVGPTREDDYGGTLTPSVAALHELTSAVQRIAPRLRRASVKGIRCGLRSMSPDGSVVVGRVPHRRHVVIANGLDGFGLQLGPFTGALAATIALDPSNEQWTQFAPARFLANPAGFNQAGS